MPSPTHNSRSPSADREALSGLVQRVTFHNNDTGFAVLKVKVRGHRELVAVIGQVPSISVGEHLQASGKWERNPQHGLQFRARLLQVTPPNSLEGIERYLGSGLIRGIGPTYAKRLVRAFGEDVFEVVEKVPKRLREVPGIGPLRAARITQGWSEQKTIREIMVFLQSHGVSTAQAVRIFKTYGADAVPLVSEDPYRLARDIRGVGFRSADQIARKLGISSTSPLRARAGLSYVLGEAVGRGHCALPREDLLRTSSDLLEIPREILEEALTKGLDANELIADPVDGTECIFLPTLWDAERAITKSLAALVKGPPSWHPIEASAAVPWVEKRLRIELAPSQRRALATILSTKVSAVTGGPGVGKTTLVRAVLTILGAKGVAVALCAPTGRAAKRLNESTGLEAKTIHRLLEAGPKGFKRDADNPLECDLLVVDETSMVDVSLMSLLLRALPSSSALLLIGDVDQLPSVGPGQVLSDILQSGAIPVARLVEVFRQEGESAIILNAHRVNRGEMPDLNQQRSAETEDFYFVEAETPEDAAEKVVRMVSRRIPKRFGLDPVRDIQVLCPMNRGALGTQALNQALQATLNPSSGFARVERFGTVYRLGDKIMQTSNDYEKDVFNGDLGSIESIDHEAQDIVLRFEDRSINYRFGELDNVALAYAMTIHKSQGSEYPAVVIPVSTQHYVMLKRNLLYTAITRARRLVVLVGQPRALGIAIQSGERDRRWTRLLELLASPEALQS